MWQGHGGAAGREGVVEWVQDVSAAGAGPHAGAAKPPVPVPPPQLAPSAAAAMDARQRREKDKIPPLAPNTSSERPCTHNNWDNVRVKKGFITLRCRDCQLQWKTETEKIRKCPQFFADTCAAGRDCPMPHIHRYKQGEQERRRIWGDELLVPKPVWQQQKETPADAVEHTPRGSPNLPHNQPRSTFGEGRSDFSSPDCSAPALASPSTHVTEPEAAEPPQETCRRRPRRRRANTACSVESASNSSGAEDEAAQPLVRRASRPQPPTQQKVDVIRLGDLGASSNDDDSASSRGDGSPPMGGGVRPGFGGFSGPPRRRLLGTKSPSKVPPRRKEVRRPSQTDNRLVLMDDLGQQSETDDGEEGDGLGDGELSDQDLDALVKDAGKKYQPELRREAHRRMSGAADDLPVQTSRFSPRLGIGNAAYIPQQQPAAAAAAAPAHATSPAPPVPYPLGTPPPSDALSPGPPGGQGEAYVRSTFGTRHDAPPLETYSDASRSSFGRASPHPPTLGTPCPGIQSPAPGHSPGPMVTMVSSPCGAPPRLVTPSSHSQDSARHPTRRLPDAYGVIGMPAVPTAGAQPPAAIPLVPGGTTVAQPVAQPLYVQPQSTFHMTVGGEYH